MKFIKRIRIERHTPINTKKELSPKTARRLFWLVLLVIIGLLPFTIMKAQQTLRQAKIVEKRMLTMVEKNKAVVLGQSASGSPLFQLWMDPFVDTYMNVSMEEPDFSERIKKLESLIAADLGEAINNGVSQKLLKKELYDLKNEKEFLVAVYRVSYEVITPVKKEKDSVKEKKKGTETTVTEEKKENTILLNIPFQEVDGKFKVMALPYYTNEQDLTKKNVVSLQKEKNLNSLNHEENKNVNKFVSDFLRKYCEGNTNEMQYVMERPESLSGYDLSEYKIESKERGGGILVYATLYLKDKNTALIHKEQMSLLINKKEKMYFVEKMTHYLGGLLDE